jgi:steroid delta-isomerase-like uncharacterized protein
MSQPTAASADALDAGFLTDFAERWHGAWNSKDASRVAALCTEDVEVVDPSQPGPLHGHGGIRALVEQLARAFPDYEFATAGPMYVAASGRRAVMPWRFTGTMTGRLDPPGFAPTNGRVTFDGLDEWEFRGELIARTRAHYDLNGAAVQIGAAPAPGTPGERLGVLVQRLEAARRRRTRG